MKDSWSGGFVEIGGRQMRWATDLKSPSRIEPYHAYRSLTIFPSDRANVAELIGICGLCACHNEGVAIEKTAPFLHSLVYEGVSQLAIDPTLWTFAGQEAEIEKFRSWIGEGDEDERRHRAQNILNFRERPTNRFLVLSHDLQPLLTNELSDIIGGASLKSGRWLDIKAITLDIRRRHHGAFFQFQAN